MHRDAGTTNLIITQRKFAATSKSYIDLLISLEVTESHTKMLDYTSELLAMKDFIDLTSKKWFNR